MLVTLRYQDELRPASGIDLPPESLMAAGVSAKEIELAKRLVDDMTERWNPSAFKDSYHDDLMARIRQKIKQGKTREITTPGSDDDGAPRSAQIIDLADLLKQSLGKGAAPRKAAAAKETPAQRAKPSLRVVTGARAATKRAAKSAARPPARRKRA
jgi:DNA end-binding protein Ku